MSTLDVAAIRSHFIFPATGRVVTNNAATTQPPVELVELFRSLAPSYENVHRGQSQASRATTALFEESYDTIARFLNAPRPDLVEAMRRIGAHTRKLTERALERLSAVPGLRIYGPRSAARRTALVAFNIEGKDPFAVAEALSSVGVEARAGCHCATLAHRALGLDPAASCRLSFYFYNTLEEVDCATAAVAAVAREHDRASS